MKDLNSGFCDLQTCGETSRFESIRQDFVSPLAHLWTISLANLAALLPLSRTDFYEYKSSRVNHLRPEMHAMTKMADLAKVLHN